jgi:hypothetical protein
VREKERDKLDYILEWYFLTVQCEEELPANSRLKMQNGFLRKISVFSGYF